MGVVAALAAEAHTLGPAARRADSLRVLRGGHLLCESGIGARAAAGAARALADAGVAGLISWGMAGGLDPSLRAGDLVLADAIIDADGRRFAAAPAWQARIAAGLPSTQTVRRGSVYTSPAALDTTAAKQTVFHRTAAVAVDMESAAIAAVAADRGLPFVAIRVIVDTAADSLPRLIMAASASGQVDLWLLLRGLAAAPGEIGALLRLSRRYQAALRSLRHAARAGVAAA